MDRRASGWRSMVWCVLALPAAALACSSSPTERTGTFACSGEVQVTASEGTTPVFGWTPACGMSYLMVRPVTPLGHAEPSIWGVEMSGPERLAPGVRYGSTPRGGRAFGPPAPLVRGTAYRVEVLSLLGGDVRVGGGEAVFTP